MNSKSKEKELNNFKKFWLFNIEGLGIKRIKYLINEFGTYENIYDFFQNKNQYLNINIPQNIQKDMLDFDLKNSIYEKWKRLNKGKIKFIAYDDEKYPNKLLNIDNIPKALYCYGDMPDTNRLSIGIVGARDCSLYGKDMAQIFAFRLAKAGINIISGLAKGIDGFSHKGALEAGGKTYAVLGCSVDICYPKEHINIYESLKNKGGIISEFPLNTTAKPNFFPLRNRIISGLADGILVIEARRKSGSLITVDRALEQGKDVFVIPGRIGDKLSEGCNRLICQGAIPVLSPLDILEHYNINLNKETLKKESDKDIVYELIEDSPKHIENILNQCNLSEFSLRQNLIILEKENLIRQISKDYYMRK